MTETGQNILQYFVGDDKNITVTLYDEDGPEGGNLIPIVGCKFTWVIYNKTTKTILLTKTSDSGEITIDVGNSQITIIMDRDDTLNITPKTYLHECEMLDNNGHYSTMFTGEIQFLLSKANNA